MDSRSGFICKECRWLRRLIVIPWFSLLATHCACPSLSFRPDLCAFLFLYYLFLSFFFFFIRSQTEWKRNASLSVPRVRPRRILSRIVTGTKPNENRRPIYETQRSVKAILDGIPAGIYLLLLFLPRFQGTRDVSRGIVIRIHWITTSRCELTLDAWEREMDRRWCTYCFRDNCFESWFRVISCLIPDGD